MSMYDDNIEVGGLCTHDFVVNMCTQVKVKGEYVKGVYDFLLSCRSCGIELVGALSSRGV